MGARSQLPLRGGVGDVPDAGRRRLYRGLDHPRSGWDGADPRGHGVVAIALDPVTAHVVAPRPWIHVPDDAIEALEEQIPVEGDPGILALVEDAVPIDKVLGLRSAPTVGLGPAARGPVLFELARSIRNLAMVGGLGLKTVGRVLANADVVEARWSNTEQLIDVIASALDA